MADNPAPSKTAKISCIVPAYNEGQRINGVLNALVGHPLLDEVIVVNDGSKDDTEAVLRERAGIELVTYPDNHGKTYALVRGFKRARNDLVMLVDSDLIGLTPAHITALIEPVRAGQADIALSLRQNSSLLYKLFGLDFVSGERVFSKSILGDLDQMDRLPGFGFETYLNQIIVSKKLRIKSVKWRNVITPRKKAKFGYWEGQKQDLKMIREILSLVGGRRLLLLFWAMYRLKV